MSQSITPTTTTSDSDRLAQLFREAAGNQDGNVHDFNRSFVRPNLALLEGMFERKYGLDFVTSSTASTDFASLRVLLRSYLEARLSSGEAEKLFSRDVTAGLSTNPVLLANQLLGELDAAFDKLESHCEDRAHATPANASAGASYADAETGVMDVVLLLRKNWFLAQEVLGGQPGRSAAGNTESRDHSVAVGARAAAAAPSSPYAPEAGDVILESLLENHRTLGGCAPGFAGRFVRDLLQLLAHAEGLTEEALIEIVDGG